MPKAEAAIKRFALAHRENAGGGSDPTVAHNHAAIVERRFRMEKRKQKLGREMTLRALRALARCSRSPAHAMRTLRRADYHRAPGGHDRRLALATTVSDGADDLGQTVAELFG